jgi:hypothetical protein
MSLPGLQLEAPVESVSAPAIHEIEENSEWRFEVPFGSKVEVKVGGKSLGIYHNRWADTCLCVDSSSCPGRLSFLALNSLKNNLIPSAARKQQSLPGMAAESRLSVIARSNILPRKPP